ncbi:hypothetical protein PIB30_064437 [Stylosanthes scabra]|uniref:Uncharacterized protein n=1 Tax=Stylosanthes scabra TaxID=79078 RepID=A0ABU6RMA6_9FABA|nr:hypothetical protein [Stylosanthes scabra]
MVTPVVNPSFPLAALRLRSIGDIFHAERSNEVEMFDVVALVVSWGDPRVMQSKIGKDLKSLGIVVEDLKKNRISRALFDGHVDGILPHLEEPRDEPLIVMFHYFKATRALEWLGVDARRTSSRISRVSSRSTTSLAANEFVQGNACVMKIEDVVRLCEEKEL